MSNEINWIKTVMFSTANCISLRIEIYKTITIIIGELESICEIQMWNDCVCCDVSTWLCVNIVKITSSKNQCTFASIRNTKFEMAYDTYLHTFLSIEIGLFCWFVFTSIRLKGKRFVYDSFVYDICVQTGLIIQWMTSFEHSSFKFWTDQSLKYFFHIFIILLTLNYFCSKKKNATPFCIQTKPR